MNHAEQIESLLIEFDQGMHRGESIDLRELMTRVPIEHQHELLTELLKIDLEYCWKNGKHQLVEEYLVVFPELGQVSNLPPDLIEEEIYCRQRYETNPEFSEIEERFPDRASQFRSILNTKRAVAADSRNKKSLASLLSEQSGIQKSEESEISATNPKVLGGRFELKDRLGQGAFATVFRAWDRTLQRPVAVKIARRALANDPAMAQRFLREAQSAARLEHPGIVSVYEVGEQDDQFYMVQELIQGGTLADDMKGREELPFQETASRVAGICNALDYAHRCGIVHRDIKPANIMLDRDNKPRIADFGLATQADSDLTLTHEGDLLGTPAYMAPEQARGNNKAVGPAADTYAVGVMLYQMMCGQLPFQGDPAVVISKIINEEPLAPRKLIRSVPLDLQTICQKAMEKESANRYRSAGAMADDLDRFINGEPISARPAGPVEHFWKWCKRRPTLAGTLAISMLLLSCLAVFSYVGISNERDKFREQRDLANAETERANQTLFEALTQNVQNELQSKPKGWYDRCFKTISDAASIKLEGRNDAKLRELAVEMLTDTATRFSSSTIWEPHRTDVSVADIEFGLDGKLAACSYNDGVVRLVDPAHKQFEVFLLGPEKTVRNLHFGRNNKWLVGRSGRQIWKWDLPDHLLANPPTTIQGETVSAEPCSCLALSRNQNQIALGKSNGEILIFEWHDGAIGEFEFELQKHKMEVEFIEFSPGDLLLASWAQDKLLVQWDLAMGNELASQETTDPISCLHYGDTERRLTWSDIASFSYRTWDLGDQVQNFPSPGVIREVELLKHKQAVSVSLDGVLRLWNSNNVLAEVEGLGQLRCLAASSDQQSILVGKYDGKIQRFDLIQSEYSDSITSTHRCAFDRHDVIHSERGRTTVNINFSENEYSPYHRMDVHCFAEDATRSLLYAGTSNGNLVILNMESEEHETLQVSKDTSVAGVFLSIDDSFLFTVSHDGKVVCRDAESRQEVWEARFATGKVESVSASLDGRWIAIGTKQGYEILDTLKDAPLPRTLISQYQIKPIVSFGFNDLLLARSDGRVEVRNPSGKKVKRKLDGWGSPVVDMKFTADGEKLIVATKDQQLLTCTWPDGETIVRSTTTQPVLGIQLDVEDEYIVTSEPGNFQLRNAANQVPQIRSAFGYTTPAGIYFDRSGTRFWVGNSGIRRFDRTAINKLRLLHVNSQQISSLSISGSSKPVSGGYTSQVWGVAHANKNPWTAFTDHDGQVTVFDSNTGIELVSMNRHAPVVWSADFAPDDSALVTGGALNGKGETIIWDTDTWKVRHRIKVGKQLVSSVDFHPTLPLIAAATYGGTVDLIDSNNGKIDSQTFTVPGRVDSCEFSPNGKWLAAACGAHGVIVWPLKIEGGRAIVHGDPDIIHVEGEQFAAVTFADSGEQIAIGSQLGTVRIYDVDSRKMLMQINGGPLRIRQLAFSKANRFLACTGYVNAGKVWNLRELEKTLAQLKVPVEMGIANSKRTKDGE